MQLRIQPDRAADAFALTDHHVGSVGNHAPIPPLDPEDPAAELWVREHLSDTPVRIPRDRWAFARGEEGAALPGPGSVSLAGGFEAGRIYDLLYTPAECPVVGAGLLAMRDLAAIPGFALARSDRLPSLAPMDLGEHADRGVPAFPARFVGEPYPSSVSAVDADGNETGGVRMPDVSVPVATHAGFQPAAPRERRRRPDSRVSRIDDPARPHRGGARGPPDDPRPSLAERYASRDAYLAEVRAAAERLVESRYLLAVDVSTSISASRSPANATTRVAGPDA